MVVVPRFWPEVGGVESYVAWTVRTMRDAGHQVVVVTTGARDAEAVWEDVPVVRLGVRWTLSNTPLSPAWPRRLRRLVREHRPDVIAAHAPVPGLADLAVALSGRVPVVLTYHAGSLVKGGSRAVDALLRAYERWVLPRVFARAAALVAVSPVSLAHATGRAALVPPGVDTAVFTPAPAPAARRVLYAGRLESSSRWKGVHVLVEAIGLLAEQGIEVDLDLVGDGDDVPALREQARGLGIADRVHLRGALDQAALAAAYRSADACVLPSLSDAESFGMTLVEAMACGRPVVGSRVGGIPFVVRDGVDGLLVTPGDATELAGAVQRLVSDPALAARLGAAGRRAAEERWDWSHRRAELLAQLAAVSAKPGPGQAVAPTMDICPITGQSDRGQPAVSSSSS